MKLELTKVAFVYLQKNNKILLLQEGGRLANGLWCLPGGHVDEGETFAEAAVREAVEESGYQVSLDKIIYQSIITSTEYKGSFRDTPEVELCIYKGKILGGELKLDDQALDLQWLSKEEFMQKSLRWSFLKDLILANFN